MCARGWKCVGDRSGHRATTTVSHAESSFGNGNELGTNMHTQFGMRWRGRGTGAFAPCQVSIWGGFQVAAARHLHGFAPLLPQGVGLSKALP